MRAALDIIQFMTARRIRSKSDSASSTTNIGRRREANSKDGSDFYADRRHDILRAAGEIFKEKGYESATMADIALRLGTDRATIYYYVSSKSELMQSVVREVTNRNVTAIEEIVRSNYPAREKLRLAFVTQMECYKSSYPYLHVFLQEKFPTLARDRSGWNNEIKDFSKRYFKAFGSIIQQGVECGEMNSDLPPELSTHAVIGMINWAHRWYKPDGNLSPERIGDGFAKLILDGLLAEPCSRKGRLSK